jgi:hypothetical protein
MSLGHSSRTTVHPELAGRMLSNLMPVMFVAVVWNVLTAQPPSARRGRWR